jgi:hypothetical protein
MPRNVRNFWIEANIDGRATAFVGGPQSKDGGFDMRILQRDNGDIITALHVRGFVDSDGNLQVIAETDDGNRRIEVQTVR